MINVGWSARKVLKLDSGTIVVPLAHYGNNLFKLL